MVQYRALLISEFNLNLSRIASVQLLAVTNFCAVFSMKLVTLFAGFQFCDRYNTEQEDTPSAHPCYHTIHFVTTVLYTSNENKKHCN